MGANRSLPHVLILPEDDANGDIANGFFLEIPFEKQRAFQVLAPSKGWSKAVERACGGDCEGLRSYPNRHLIVLIDFDDEVDRLATIQQKIPLDLEDRIFILGSRKEPQDLRSTLGNFEDIGRKLAVDCRDDTNKTWGHKLLIHNMSELDRTRKALSNLLFG